MINNTLGILGGMGPLASTAFLQTIYDRVFIRNPEQEFPYVIVHSMPNIPDRTNAIKTNDRCFPNILRNRLTMMNPIEGISGEYSPISKIVICCTTSHYFLANIPTSISNKIISLIDVMDNELNRRQAPALLLASKGSYQKGLLSKNKNVIVPSTVDQALIHKLIYEKLKTGNGIGIVFKHVAKLLNKYETSYFIAGCTEFHILTRYLIQRITPLDFEFDFDNVEIKFIDPLFTIADNLNQFMSN